LLKNVCSDYSACHVLCQLLLEQIEDFTPLFGLLYYKVTNPAEFMPLGGVSIAFTHIFFCWQIL
jgi:hypothetical protein